MGNTKYNEIQILELLAVEKIKILKSSFYKVFRILFLKAFLKLKLFWV